MLSAQALCELMPHTGAMCLIQELISWDQEKIVCRSHSHLCADNPLRNHDRLSAIHAVEYGAQAIGLHGGLLTKATGEPPRSGLLVSMRGVKLHREHLDDCDDALTIKAHRLLADNHNLLYAFDLSLNHQPVAEGRAAIITHVEK